MISAGSKSSFELAQLKILLLDYNKMRNLVIFVLLILKVVEVHGATTFTVGILNNRTNAVTNYTWTLAFTDLSSRTWMMFTFPPSVTLTNNSVSYIGTNSPAVNALTSNSINISTSGFTITNPFNVVITNVTNPFSALTSVTSFFFSSSLDSPSSLSLTASKDYQPGTLSCTWSFNKCTEQTNSTLTITLSTANRIPAGSSIISVDFPSIWVNQNQRSLLYGVSGLNCSMNINNGTIVPSGVSCTYSSSEHTITVSYTLPTQIDGSDVILVYIQGVMSPPTATTPSDTQYTTSTTDTLGNVIDGVGADSYCTILPVCVTNFTDGTFLPSPLFINTQTAELTVNFNGYPTISFLRLDSVVTTYSDQSNLNSCGTFRVMRGGLAYGLTNNSTGGVMSYFFPSSASNLPNNDYGNTITIHMVCSLIKTSSSETPQTFLFTFKRNNAEYMQLSGTFTAVATVFNAANGLLTLTNYQMASTATTYLFNFTTGQALGSSPAFVLSFPADISLTGVTCQIGVNTVLSPTACTPSATTVTINYSSGGAAVGSGSTILIQIAGITNPLLPTAYTFGLTTYYNSSVMTSRVEYNTAAFTTTYTTITNLPVQLTPSTFTVYTFTRINMSFTSPLNIPELSTFSLTFPADVTQISPPTQPLLLNSSFVLLNSSPSTAGSTVTFHSLQVVPINSNLVITLSIRTPAYINTFSFIQLEVRKGNSTFFQSLASTTISVTTPGAMPASIAPHYSLTGATSPYLITLTLAIPHPAAFKIQVAVGSDVTFMSGSSNCTNICTSLLPLGINGFTVTVDNPYPNSIFPANIDLTISNFTNSRNIGLGLAWTITTMTTSGDLISSQTASPTISVPNILSGSLLSTQFYFRNNTNTVKVQLNFANLLQSTDYLLFTMDRTTYNVFTTINCSPAYGTCAINSNSSTANVLVIKIIPNSGNILSNPLELWIEGLISGANTYYLQTNYITVGSYNLEGNLIDQGKIEYNISCRDSATLAKNCKTCSGGNCIDCYLSQGYYLNGTSCVTSCGDATNFLSYANSTSGTCQSCSGTSSGCLTCINSTACLTCLNSSYYLYPSTLVCSMFCLTSLGYIGTTMSEIAVCVRCADPNCLICTSTSYGTCTTCTNGSILISGVCSSSCLSPSFYVLNANCVACDPSCYTCFGPDNRTCQQCSMGYYNLSGVCTNTCPSGTAVILSTGSCGCATACLTCDSSNFANCTACNNMSLFAYNGQCVASCPNSSYQNGTSCIACSTGCLSCAQTVCLACTANWFSFGAHCYSDCNLVSQQYDSDESRCILCPSGCDTCSGGACSSCLSEYSLSSSSCILTCQLTNSCEVDVSNIMPLPGSIAVLVWLAVVIVVHLFSHKNYIPYSLVLFTSVVEFILVLAVVSSSNGTVGRLLTYLQASTRSVIVGLLAFTVAINYVTNAIYLYIFVKYIKPLIVNPKQIDFISNVIILVVAAITNYRFAMIAFARMFPKPNIQVQMAKHLTPIHYLCIGSVILSIFPLMAAGIGLNKYQKLTTQFMLCLDLMLVIILNILITFWFIMGKKDDSYFENEHKKEYTSDNMDNMEINVTKQNINGKNEKDASDVNMIMSFHGSQEKNSQESDDYDFGEAYKKFKAKKTKIYGNKDNNTVLIRNNSLGPSSNTPNKIDKSSQRLQQIKKSDDRNIFAIDNEYEPQPIFKGDVNFEQRVQKPGLKRTKNQMSRATTVNRSRPELLKQEPEMKSIEFDEHKFEKQLFKNQQQYKQSSDSQSDAGVNEVKFGQSQSYLSSISLASKQKLPQPKRNSNNSNIGYKKQLIKSLENQTAMRKNNKRYMQANATDKQKETNTLQSKDLAAIIKLKIQESSIRTSQNITVITHQENDLEQISPSYYNAQNQRFQIEDVVSSEEGQP